MKNIELRAVLAAILFVGFIVSRVLEISLYIGSTADYIISTILFLVILYLILPFSKTLTNIKSAYCKSFGK